MKRLLCMLLAALLLPGMACAQTLRIYGVFQPESFAAANPEADVIIDDASEWDELDVVTRLTTGEFASDVFSLQSDIVDLPLLMDKGYCLDLSGSEALMAAVKRMHPAVQQMVMRDGKLCGLPTYLNLDLTWCNQTVWEAAGYTAEDVPKTFPALLDFLEGWCARVENEPEADICVLGMSFWGDESFYDRTAYADWLVKLLLDDYMAQRQYAGETLRFDDPLLAQMLTRAREIGLRIYDTEPNGAVNAYGQPLFRMDRVGLNWDEVETCRISARLSEDQPMLLAAQLRVAMVGAGTREPELAISLLEHIQQGLMAEPVSWELLYADQQPIVDEDQQDDIRHWGNLVALAEHRLAQDAAPYTEYMDLAGCSAEQLGNYAINAATIWNLSDAEVEEMRERWARYLQKAQEEPYLLSPDALAAHLRMAEGFCFLPPSVFQAGSENGANYRSLVGQFVDGRSTAQELLSGLDRMAWMIALENQ